MSKLYAHYRLYRTFAHSIRGSFKLGLIDWRKHGRRLPAAARAG